MINHKMYQYVSTVLSVPFLLTKEKGVYILVPSVIHWNKHEIKKNKSD